MAEPDVAEGGETDEPSPDNGDDSVEMVQTSVAESGVDPEGFFDDVEPESGNSGSADDLFDGVEEGDSEDSETPTARDTRSTGLADDINNGAARLSVVGLDEEWETEDGTKTKDDLEDEFREVFEAFRLGHYGATVVEEYILVENEDINPVWGLVGAMLICAAVVMFKRPDGDQLIENGKTKLGDFNLDTLREDD